MRTALEDVGRAAADWDALADRVGAGPFHRPAWVRAHVEAFSPAARLVLATARADDGTLRAAIPFLHHGRELVPPTNDHTPSFGPVYDGPEAAAALAGLLAAGDATRVMLRPFDASDPFRDHMRSAAAGRRMIVHEHVMRRAPYVELTGEGPAALVSRGLRKEIGRGRRRLGELGELRLQIASTPAELPGALADLLAIEALGWKGEGGTAMASDPAAERFYRAVATWAAETRRLRLAVLRVDERPVAAELDILDGDVLYALKMGVAPEYRRTGPGHILMWMLLERVGPEDGVRRYEMLGEDDPYKMRWTDRTREMTEMSVFPRSPGGALAFGRHRLAPAVARRARPALASAMGRLPGRRRRQEPTG